MAEGTQKTKQEAAPEKSAGIFRRSPEAEVDLVTDIRASLLVQSPRGGRMLIWLVALFFFVFLLWAGFAEIDEVTRGNGKVIPSQQIQVVQNLEGGILSKLLAKVGDVVNKGDLLLEIDKTRFSASYMESRANYLALKAQTARLEAETNNTPFTVPEEVRKENPEIGEREQQLYNSRQNQLSAKLQILQEQYKQRQQELAELRSKIAELNRTNGLVQRELGMLRPLIGKGAVSEVEVLRLQQKSSEMRGNIETSQLAVPKLESKVAEAAKSMEEERLSFRNAAHKELNEAYARLESLSAASVELEDRLRRTEVRSPVRGTINQIKVNTVGGAIQPGMDLVEIVPLEDSLLIEARIKPEDIASLRPNQEAIVKFTAYDFTTYGGLEAHLEHISADSITDKQENDYYLVRLRTKQNYLSTTDEPIIPGMVVSVDILTGKKTILSYLLKPVLRARDTALREK